ncbi:MAG TPA: 2-dehydropantoate 2-reductase N-terminal domain-containing protein [Flavisolibacter sp.]|nr:2-dehydropantoate 2-reductase N-terminal domain-containing protein [Flavisolibacter sp.]
MKHKETIAVIGAVSEEGQKVLGFLLQSGQRLLLMDEAADQLLLLHQSLSALHPEAEIDIQPCCREASWEADLIILAKPQPTPEAAIQKMKEVANNKIIVCFNNNDMDLLELLQKELPYSRVISMNMDKESKQSEFAGSHQASVETVAGLFTNIK